MIIAICVLLVVILLSTAAVATSVQTNAVTRRDANYKNALEAAEAGLQVALYRLNMDQPASTGCVGDTFESTPDDGIWCTSSVTSLGNGSTYQYYTSQGLGSGQTCVGEQLNGNDISQRCVTAVGVSNGVTARSQIRTGTFTAAPLFQIAGVTGLNQVSLSGNGAVNGVSGSNGNVGLNGNANSQGIDLGPAGTYTHSGNASGGTVSPIPTIVLNPVNPGNSATTNDDSRITNGIYNAAHPTSTPETPYDQASSGGVSFNASTRTLSISGNGSLTLGGGLYNFCELDMSGNAQLSIASGVEAEIFIDSPSDPNSGCASGTGSVNLSGNGAVNPSQNPLALQLYVYGDPSYVYNSGKSDSDTATISGNGNFYGVLYAPNSAVTLSGNGVVDGGVAGEAVDITGNGFNWNDTVASIQASTTNTYFRTAWAQCTPSYTASSPGSNC